MSRIPLYLLDQTADELEEASEACTYSKGGDLRYQAEQLLVEAAHTIRRADQLLKEAEEQEEGIE